MIRSLKLHDAYVITEADMARIYKDPAVDYDKEWQDDAEDGCCSVSAAYWLLPHDFEKRLK